MKEWLAATNPATTSHDMNTNNETKTEKQKNANSEMTVVASDKRVLKLKRLKSKAPSPPPTSPAEVIKVGVDVGLKKYLVCRQVDGSLAEAPRAMKPKEFKTWVSEQRSLAKQVAVCYEAGVFGFELARWIEQEKMKCVVMAPIKLDEGNKRVETDKLNARDIGSRLDRYLAGNTRALTACFIPKREDELARQQARQRQQLMEHRNALAAQGRCLLWEFGHVEEEQGWWEEVTWLNLDKRINDPQVHAMLIPLRAVILVITEQLSTLMTTLRKQSETDLPEPLREKLPLGMGWLSIFLLTREIMDWKRFGNRRHVGGFSGLVPSESSTGQSIRQGSITKVGNPRVRTILVEMAWRLVHFQPNCHAVKPWIHVLTNKKAGARVRKRAIVAVARVLSVDIWRLATGQTTFEKLGLKVMD